MSRKRKQTPPNQDVEMVAIWLHGACGGDPEEFKLIRSYCETAMANARAVYLTKKDEVTVDGTEPTDDYGIIECLTRFLCKLDQLERERLEDEK